MEIMENGQNLIIGKKNQNEINIEEGNKSEQKTFQRIKELQKLLKKESEMKEQCMQNKFIYFLLLVIKARNKINKNIEENCRNICITKLKIKKKLDKTHKLAEIELINMKEEEGVYLKELNIYIIKLLDYLWVEPKLVANLLLCAKKEDIENNLSPLIGNFFYENIISPDYIQDKLLYVITYLLKNEIMNLNSKTDYGIFLDNTSAGFLINELIKYEYEFKEYFRRIIIKTIEKLEIEYSRMKLNFIIPYKIIDNDKDDTLAEEAEIDKAYCENQLIINNYFVNFKKDYIEKEKQKHQNDNGKNIYDEYLNMINNDHLKKYDNKLFFESLEIGENLKKSYIHNFCLVVDCIDQIISDFLINLNAFPHSLKCIGKIISELIQQRQIGRAHV